MLFRSWAWGSPSEVGMTVSSPSSRMMVLQRVVSRCLKVHLVVGHSPHGDWPQWRHGAPGRLPRRRRWIDVTVLPAEAPRPAMEKERERSQASWCQQSQPLQEIAGWHAEALNHTNHAQHDGGKESSRCANRGDSFKAMSIRDHSEKRCTYLCCFLLSFP